MSICAPCVRLQDISLCTDELVIGYSEDPGFSYALYFRSLSTDATYVYHVESDSNNKITLALPDGFPLATNQAYEMWITSLGDGIENRLPLAINVYTALCYTISGRQVYNPSAGYFENYPTQTLARL